MVDQPAVLFVCAHRVMVFEGADGGKVANAEVTDYASVMGIFADPYVALTG